MHLRSCIKHLRTYFEFTTGFTGNRHYKHIIELKLLHDYLTVFLLIYIVELLSFVHKFNRVFKNFDPSLFSHRAYNYEKAFFRWNTVRQWDFLSLYFLFFFLILSVHHILELAHHVVVLALYCSVHVTHCLLLCIYGEEQFIVLMIQIES